MPIRIRLAVLFAVASGVAILVGILIYTHVLAHELYSTVDSGLGLQVQTARASLAQSVPPGEVLSSIPAFQRADFAQIFDPNGALVASSQTVGKAALLDTSQLRVAARQTLVVDPRVRLSANVTESEHVRMLASPVRIDGGTGVLVVGTSLDSTDDALDHITDTASWGGPIAAVLAGFAAWLLAGAALRPVERMRRQAATMSTDEAAAGIAVPTTRDEIAALARTMNDLVGRLHMALSRERAFVADAGHELRTPLAILCAELELAARPGRSPHDLREAVTRAAEESQRLAALANDLLVLGRDNNAEVSVQREPTALAELIRAAVSHLTPRSDEAQVTIRTDVTTDLVADIDPGRIRRLVDNLLDNAIRHTPPEGTVTVAAAPHQDALRITVSDTGRGFPVDFLPHAFERFGRADASRARDTGGTGLGLAIVASISGAHGGTVNASNDPDGGARVTVEIPHAVLTDLLDTFGPEVRPVRSVAGEEAPVVVQVPADLPEQDQAEQHS